MQLDKNRIYLSPPHINGQEKKYIDEAFSSNWIAPLGPHVDAFETELADYLGVSGVVALSSGTAAIHLSLQLLGVSPGDFVFCSALTFVASVNPVLYCGAQPIFIDSEPKSWNMCPKALERALHEFRDKNYLPKAIIVVNLYGQSADIVPIIKLCDQYDIPVVEDAAESLGATYQKRKSGSFGAFGILSFNGNKIITTSGGGALISDNLDYLKRARYLATQARQPARHYEHTEVGYNYRLSNILAAIGRGQLETLNEKVTARRNIFKRYYDALNSFDGIEFMSEAEYGYSTHWLTVLTVNPKITGVNRDIIIDSLELENIEARPVWKPMQLQPLYAGCHYYEHEIGNSISEKLFEQGLCLPSGSNLTAEEQTRVINCITRLIETGYKS